ncbi:MAG: hypothetical protein ACRECH_09790 [Nitrososphaerales archaeon]
MPADDLGIRGLVCLGTNRFVMVISLSANSYAFAMTNGPSANLQVTIPCCNAFMNNEIYSRNNLPSGHFWNLVGWIGRAGGSSSQPLEYLFTLQDYYSASYNAIQQCGEDRNYWSGYSATTVACATSGYFGGLMNAAYLLINLDPSYSRIYNIETHSAYE